MHFLTPRPCCCIPVQPQKIPHHLPQSSCTKPARPFRELLRSCLPSRSPVILVCSGLPRGRRWAQWRREPAPLQHCTSCCSGPHCHNSGWLLLSEISILFVSWVRLISLIMFGFFFLFLSFNLSSLFKTTDVWETFEYFEDLATKLIMKWLEHFTQICSPAERFLGALLA